MARTAIMAPGGAARQSASAGEDWRYRSPLKDSVPYGRLGQYTGPIPLGGEIEAALVRFRFLGTGASKGTVRMSVSPGSKDGPEMTFKVGKFESLEICGLKIQAYVYLAAGDSVRCSILVDKK